MGMCQMPKAEGGQVNKEPSVAEDVANYEPMKNAVLDICFKALYDRDNENTVISPFSILQIAGLLYIDSAGEASEEISKKLGVGSDKQALAEYFRNILSRYKDMRGIIFKNSVWLAKDLARSDGFSEILSKSFNGKLYLVDFSNTKQVESAISNWALQSTDGLLSDLKASFNPSTRICALNVSAFRQKWLNAFEKYNTVEKTFETAGKNINVPFMVSEARCMDYFSDDNYFFVAIPYASEGLSMVIAKPKIGVPSNTLSAKSLGMVLEKLKSRSASREVKLFLPKFSITQTELSIIPYLKNIGINKIFNSGNSFKSLMPPSYIESISSGAKIEIDEEGTVAVGYTIGMETLGGEPLPPVNFICDRPFMFFIVDDKTGLVIFMGKVNDPSKN